MPTAVSSTEGLVGAARRAVGDVGHLVRFRVARRRRRASYVVLGVVGALTLAVATGPAFVAGAGSSTGDARDVLLLLPSALTGFVLLAVVSAAASGGGRELLARDPAAVFPVSPTTDHLGALLLAPLNIAWVLQAWILLGATAYAVGTDSLAPAQLVVVLWLAAGTALAQVLAWTLEGVRRTTHGIALVRLLGVAGVAAALALQLGGRLVDVLDRLPTVEVVVSMTGGFSGRWVASVLLGVLAFVVLVALGAWPAHLAARRVPRDELKVESGRYPARPVPASVLGAMVRIDRASVWRAVPMRRGALVLALGPALVALLGGLEWSTMTILPGLVASGGALLYGVNAWCLDSRGTLWRESLPVPPATVFDARSYVLAEFLVGASLLTVCVAGLRAGLPAAPEAAAMLCTLLVVTVQVVGAAMRWSQQRPYAVDLRSARATPAPPATMVVYSSRLALSTTVTGLFFSVPAQAGAWWLSPAFAVPMLAWSAARFVRTRRAWVEPLTRARVVMTVSAA